MCVCVCMCVCVYILFYIIFHYGLSQATEYSSLCYTTGPGCLSIFYSLHLSQTPNPFLPQPTHLGNQRSVLYVCEFISVS